MATKSVDTKQIDGIGSWLQLGWFQRSLRLRMPEQGEWRMWFLWIAKTDRLRQFWDTLHLLTIFMSPLHADNAWQFLYFNCGGCLPNDNGLDSLCTDELWWFFDDFWQSAEHVLMDCRRFLQSHLSLLPTPACCHQVGHLQSEFLKIVFLVLEQENLRTEMFFFLNSPCWRNLLVGNWLSLSMLLVFHWLYVCVS